MLDRWKAILQLFVAGSMMRILSIRPLESYVVALSASLADLRQQVLFIKTSIGKPKNDGLVQMAIAWNNDRPFTQPNFVQHCTALIDSNFFPEQSCNSLVVDVPPVPVFNSAASSTNDAALNTASSSNTNYCNIFPADVDATSPQSANESYWTLVGSKNENLSSTSGQPKPAMNKSIIGVREVVNAKVKAITVNRSRHCKISRLAHDVTSDGVKEYIADLCVSPIPVETLDAKRGQPAAMHIEVPFIAKDNVMSSGFWHSGGRVDGWRFLYERKQPSPSNRNWAYDY